MSELLDDTDVGQLTHNLCDSAADLMDIFMKRPDRRCEFGRREMDDIVASAFALGALIRELNSYVAEQQKPRLKVVQ